MKRTLFAALTLALLLGMTVPAFAAGRVGTAAGTGAGTGVCINPIGDQVPDLVQDRLQDGTGVNCLIDGCVVPLDGTGSQAQSRAGGVVAGQPGTQGQAQLQTASGQPESAGNPSASVAKAQNVLAQNEARIEARTNMPDEIRAKFVELFNRIAARLNTMLGLN